MRPLMMLSLCFALAVPTVALAQDAGERIVTVSATGFVEREPDQAVLSLAVETFEPNAGEAAGRNAERMDALFAALRDAGIPEDRMRTTSYQIHPEYARQPPGQEQQEPRIVGYRAINMVEVRIEPVDRVGAVIDRAIGSGANRVAGISFGLRDPREARRAAIGEAVSDARAEAEALAAAIGEPLGPILDIRTVGAPSPRIEAVRELAAPASFDAMQAPTPIEPGTMRVTANVTIVYRLGGR
jgi:uncharacterized protein